MTDLIYPASTASLIRGSDRSVASEMLPVVDEHGNVVAQASRAFCHGRIAGQMTGSVRQSAAYRSDSATRQPGNSSEQPKAAASIQPAASVQQPKAAASIQPAAFVQQPKAAASIQPAASVQQPKAAASIQPGFAATLRQQSAATAPQPAAKPLHPVVHLHIISRDGSIYLQQRSASKDFLPLKWDTAVGGHVAYGEYILEALYREASEELGFTDFNPVFITSYVYESERERELVNVFATVGDFVLKPDGDEVTDGRYWSTEEIEAAAGKSILTPNFESEYHKIKDSLQALL